MDGGRFLSEHCVSLQPPVLTAVSGGVCRCGLRKRVCLIDFRFLGAKSHVVRLRR